MRERKERGWRDCRCPMWRELMVRQRSKEGEQESKKEQDGIHLSCFLP